MAGNKSHLIPNGGRNLSFHSADADFMPKLLTYSSPPLNERMALQTVFSDTPSDTSQFSAVSFDFHTQDGDFSLFDESFVNPFAESALGDTSAPNETRNIYRGTELPTTYPLPPETQLSPNTFSTPATQEKDMWNPMGAVSPTCHPNAISLENREVYSQTPLVTSNKVWNSQEQALSDVSVKAQSPKRNRGSKLRRSSNTSERRALSPRFRTADTSRFSESNYKQNLKNAHNMVERQYRSRLNSHFASLLSTIPLDLAESQGFENEGCSKNISKAETLVLAERYIKILQSEGREYSKRNRKLEEDYERLKKAWIQLGGVMVP